MKFLLIICLMGYATADVSHQQNKDAAAKILKQELDVVKEGQYRWLYETDNGITANEHAVLVNAHLENPTIVVEGAARWTAPDGQEVELSYTADENGYHPQGTHLPRGPIPKELKLLLENIQSQHLTHNADRLQ